MPASWKGQFAALELKNALASLSSPTVRPTEAAVGPLESTGQEQAEPLAALLARPQPPSAATAGLEEDLTHVPQLIRASVACPLLDVGPVAGSVARCVKTLPGANVHDVGDPGCRITLFGFNHYPPLLVVAAVVVILPDIGKAIV